MDGENMSIIVLQSLDTAQELLKTSAPFLFAFAFGALVGSLTPTYYAGEKLRGFGRAMFNKLPYEPPPGKEEEEALIDATNEDVDEEEKEESSGEE